MPCDASYCGSCVNLLVTLIIIIIIIAIVSLYFVTNKHVGAHNDTSPHCGVITLMIRAIITYMVIQTFSLSYHQQIDVGEGQK